MNILKYKKKCCLAQDQQQLVQSWASGAMDTVLKEDRKFTAWPLVRRLSEGRAAAAKEREQKAAKAKAHLAVQKALACADQEGEHLKAQIEACVGEYIILIYTV